jgi:hypothetical protein
MATVGDHDEVRHSLIPLGLAVDLIRHKVHGERPPAQRNAEADLNALASFMAATMTLYEYDGDPSRPARTLAPRELEGGLFRNGGKELQFLDGRATKRLLAVTALDVECATALLADPEHAARIRSRFFRLKAQRLKAHAVALKSEAQRLRREVQELRVQRLSAGAIACKLPHPYTR